MERFFTAFTQAGKPVPDNRGIYCDDDGVFIGPDCALVGAKTDCVSQSLLQRR
jgi:hypothetical protein